ncbi:MAG TPA: hypothetical protein VNT01_14790, partial [Symbiobacteriaceae bacterium]|nr:hypothetical protein [Symbiobacteriaceae bacterium]
MRILPPARRILSSEERKLVPAPLSARVLLLWTLIALTLAACSRPAPGPPAPQARPEPLRAGGGAAAA